MIIYSPAYYRSFHCIAGQCPDSCCKEWEVEIDNQTAAFYRRLDTPLGDRLRAVMRGDPQWGTVMVIENQRCPMWREDGLCRIQAELGHDALCKICRDFPRLRHDYGDFQELGLELSCPESARIILSSSDATWVSEEVPGGTPPEYDRETMAILRKSRTTALELLRDFRYSVPEALTLLLYFGYQTQAVLDGGADEAFDADGALASAKAFALGSGEQSLLDFFAKLEILTPGWKELLSRPHSPAPWDERFRQLASYFVERYWLQAVSDGDLVSRVKFTVVSCILVHLLDGDLVRTAQLYSKEIENSSENVDAILDAAYTHPALTDQRLLGMLQ